MYRYRFSYTETCANYISILQRYCIAVAYRCYATINILLTVICPLPIHQTARFSIVHVIRRYAFIKHFYLDLIQNGIKLDQIFAQTKFHRKDHTEKN